MQVSVGSSGRVRGVQREVSEREGLTLTSEEAAVEWIDRYAANFPR